jgi:regulator of protease activity HflC (stomatin/prohibitin superfamily)
MFNRKTFHIPLNQRAVLIVDGRPVRALEPGRHTVWTKHAETMTWNIDELVFTAPASVLAVLPAAWYEDVHLAPTQRGVLYRDDKPVKYLRPGHHRVWKVDASIAFRVLSITDPVPELTDELRAVIPTTEIVDVTIRQHERGLKYVQGRFEELLAPGRHLFWTHQAARVAITTVDTRIQQVTIAGQELMTRDKVTLRLTLTAEYAPTDAPATAHAVADVKDALYLAVQLAAREFVAGVTLDELLEGRDTLTKYLEAEVVPRASTFGVHVHRVGVKDVILPGEMKTLLNKVIEAEKAAAANVITRREEAAATRNMATTAKVIAENPVLLRLKELEALKDIAGTIDEVRLFVGGDGIKAMLPGLAGPIGQGPVNGA